MVKRTMHAVLVWLEYIIAADVCLILCMLTMHALNNSIVICLKYTHNMYTNMQATGIDTVHVQQL